MPDLSNPLSQAGRRKLAFPLPYHLNLTTTRERKNFFNFISAYYILYNIYIYYAHI